MSSIKDNKHSYLTRRVNRRQELVTVAYQLIADQGFEGLRVREVAAAAGVNIATLHYYFPSKEDLIRGVVDHLLQLFLTMIVPQTKIGAETAKQKLQAIFLDLQDQVQRAPQMFIVLTELHLRARRDAVVRAMLKDFNDSWLAGIEAICQEGVQQRLFRANLDPYRTASAIMALINGMSLQAIGQLDTIDFVSLGSDVEQWLINPQAESVVNTRIINHRPGRKGI